MKLSTNMPTPIEQKIEELYDKYSQTPVHDRIVDVENTGIITGRISEWKGKTMKDELLPLFKEAILYGQQIKAEEVREIKVEDYLEYEPATPERRAFVEGFNKLKSILLATSSEE